MAEGKLPLIEELPQGHTQAAKEFDPRTGQVYKNDSRIVSPNGVFEPRVEGHDFSYISDAEAKNMGINPETHDACLIRNNEFWGEVEMKDRGREFLNEAGGRFIPLKNGKPYPIGDLIVAAKSKEEAEHNARLEREEADRWQRDMDDPHANLSARHRRYDKAQITSEQSRQAYEQHKADGIIGPTAGRDWREVVRKNPEQFEKDKLDFSMGSIHHNAERDEITERRRGEPSRSQETSSGFVKGSIPANVRPRNFKGAKK